MERPLPDHEGPFLDKDRQMRILQILQRLPGKRASPKGRKDRRTVVLSPGEAEGLGILRMSSLKAMTSLGIFLRMTSLGGMSSVRGFI